MKKLIQILIMVLPFFGVGQRFSTGTYFVNRTVFSYNDTMVIQALIINSDSVTFTGNMSLSAANSLGNIPGSAILPASIALNLPPGDTVQTTIRITTEPQYFKPGPDVVVIWPVIGPGPTIDPFLEIPYYINPNTSIDEAAGSSIHVWYSEGHLNWNAVDFFDVEQVRIYNLMGQSMMEISRPDRPLNVRALSAGVYVAVFRNMSGRSTYLKFAVNR